GVCGAVCPRGGVRAADFFVDSAGGWARAVAMTARIRLPLVPVRHQLFVTETIGSVPPGPPVRRLLGVARVVHQLFVTETIGSVQPAQPIVRFLEASVYVRPERGGLLVGGYEDAPLV